jgi:hypothetical protein
MKGDIFNDRFSNASGDFFPATGDMTDSCVQDPPYSASRVQMLRDRVSVCQNNVRLATAERDQAKKDWQVCKKKVFAICKAKDARLNEKEAALGIAEQAILAAQADLDQALKANADAKADYTECMQIQTARNAELARQAAAAEAAKMAAAAEAARLAAAAATTAQTRSTSTSTSTLSKVSKITPSSVAASIENSSPTAKYALIGLSIVTVGILGYYKFVKK